MFSKLRIVSYLVVAISTLSLIGCDRFLKSAQTKEEQEKQQTAEIKTKSLECLKTISADIQAFTNDQSSPEQVAEIYACIERSVNKFTLYAKGEDADHYSGAELSHFFNRYLLKNNQITDEFMTEILKLKSFIIGGSSTSISRSEITQALAYGRLIRDGAQDFRGSMKILLLRDTNMKVEAARLEELRGKFKIWVRHLVAQSKFAGSLYEFADFNEFTKELHKFLGTSSDFDRAQKYMPLVEAVKNLLIGERSDLRTQRDWQNAMDWGADAYFLGLTGVYRVQNWDFNLVETSRELVTVAERALDLVERSPVFRVLGRLDAGAIDKVIDEVKVHDLFFSRVSAKILKDSYRRLIQRVFDQNLDANARLEDVTGFEKKHLAFLHFELRAWQLSQEHLSEAFATLSPGEGVLPSALLSTAKASDVAGKIRRFKDVSDDAALLTTWNDWVTTLSQPRTLQWTHTGKLLMAQRADQAKSSLKGLTMMNALRPAVRLLLRGYGQGGSTDLWSRRIQEADLIRVEKEFHEFAVAVKFIDTRSENPAGRTFKEASFFSYAGDGNEWLTSQEIFEELNTLMAVGSGVSEKAFAQASDTEKANCSVSELDLFGLKKLNEDCFEKYLRRNFATVMEGLPMMVAEVAKMNDQQWHEFYQNFMTVAAVDDKKPGLTEFSEIRTALVTLHYVEGLIQIYDVNHDDRMQQAEIVASTPRFRSFIASQSPLGNTMVDTIFLYIVYRGRKPGMGDMLGMPGFQIELRRGMRDIGRQDLLKVLAVLKEDASK